MKTLGYFICCCAALLLLSLIMERRNAAVEVRHAQDEVRPRESGVPTSAKKIVVTPRVAGAVTSYSVPPGFDLAHALEHMKQLCAHEPEQLKRESACEIWQALSKKGAGVDVMVAPEGQ